MALFFESPVLEVGLFLIKFVIIYKLSEVLSILQLKEGKKLIIITIRRKSTVNLTLTLSF